MNYSRILIPCVLLLLVACQPKGTAPAAATAGASGAGSAPAAASDNSAPVAVVNGTPISRQLFEFYAKGMANKKSYADLTPEQKDQALDNLIRALVVEQEAVKEGLDKDPNIAPILVLSQWNVLQQSLSERYLKDKQPTEQEARAEYETQVGMLPKQEYHASHILVATEPFATKIIAELDKGGNFAEIAKRESMDPSKNNGGDIGWLTPDRMMKPFADALVSLKKGEYTHKPVQTQYGWHIIRLDETREVTPPAFDQPQIRQRLEQVVQGKKFKTYSDGLMKTAQIEKKPL
jgi:peptidyl-prolyl cis-trans isomerase C